MINISLINNERVLVPNRKVLNEIFGEFYERYVVQRKKNPEPTSE